MTKKRMRTLLTRAIYKAFRNHTNDGETITVFFAGRVYMIELAIFDVTEA